MCYQSDDRYPILHQITHMSAVFACFCPYLCIYLAVFVHFWCFDDEYICIYPCVSISYEDSSASFHILATRIDGMTKEEEEEERERGLRLSCVRRSSRQISICLSVHHGGLAYL